MVTLPYFRATPDEADVLAKGRWERSTREVRGVEPWHVTWTRRFLDHLDQQAEAHAELVDGSA